MKSIIIIIVFLLIAGKAFNQVQPATLTKEDYLLKSRHQKTAAWILVAGGITSTTIAVTIALAEASTFAWRIWLSPDGPNTHQGLINALSITGTIALIGSIPLFIAASRNKHKAVSLSFKNESSPQLYKRNFVYRAVPSLSLNISL
jgi:hypothetical protein